MPTCARCKTELTSPGGNTLTPVTSAGICPRCVEQIEVTQVMDICQYLENLPAPILVVDGDAVVRGANTKACKAVSKDLPQILNMRGGDVFECIHAKSPEGCGRTMHCSGCTVRRAVVDTLSTGVAMSGIHVEVMQRINNEDRPVMLTISTQRLANCVLFQIESGLN